VRLVAVLGFSDGGEGLHPICAARLELAARIAGEGDAVVFSGWARKPGQPAEAELMRRAWSGAACRLVVADPIARITVDNAAYVAGLVRRLGAGEVVVVTSRWHGLRAGVIFRRFLPGVRVRVETARHPSPLRVLAREAAAFGVLPFQLVSAVRRGG
jgi:DUF218 domain